MKTIEELKEMLITAINEKTKLGFPKEDIATVTAELSAGTFFNSVYNGTPFQEYYSDSIEDELFQSWSSSYRTFLEQSQNLNKGVKVSIQNVPLQEITPRAGQLLQDLDKIIEDF